MWKAVLVMVAAESIVLASTSVAADIGALQAKDPSTSIESLYKQCDDTDLYKQTFCVAYIVGVAEILGRVGLDKSARPLTGICWKGDVSYSAMVQAFKNWAQKHPEAWGIPRYGGVMWALKETWPCN
jgi:hypothetical protein